MNPSTKPHPPLNLLQPLSCNFAGTITATTKTTITIKVAMTTPTVKTITMVIDDNGSCAATTAIMNTTTMIMKTTTVSQSWEG